MVDNGFFDPNGTNLGLEENSFLFYTNNNNIRHYMSQDSIIAADLFSTEIYNQSFGDILPKGLLITKFLISNNSLETWYKNSTSDILYPIAVVIKFPLLSSVECILYDSTSNFTKTTLDKYDSKIHILAYIASSIPFSFVDKIIFRTPNELENFSSTKISNIEFNEEIFIVDNNYFYGKTDLKSNMFEDFSLFISEQKHDPILKNSRKQNIRSLLHCALYSYPETNDTDILIPFDKFSLQIFKEIMNSKRHNIDTESKEIEKVINTYLSSNLSWLSIPKNVLHSNFILHNIDVGKFFISLTKQDAFNVQEPNDLIAKLDQFFDVIAVQIAFKVLFTHQSSTFFPKAYLDDFFEELLNFVPSKISEKDLSKLDALKDRYRKAHSQVVAIIEGYGNIVNQLEKWPDNFQTIKALLFFITTSDRYKAEDLIRKINKFENNLNRNDIRLIWMLWGSLNGMVFLHYSFKSDRNSLYLSDLLSNSIYSDDFSEKNIFNFKPKYSKKKISITEGKEELILTTGLGLNFTISINKSFDFVYNQIVILLKQKKTNYLRDIFLDYQQSTKFTSWQIIPKKNCSVLIKQSEVIEILFDEKPALNKIWRDWDSFFNEHIDNKENFQKIFNDELLDKLSNYIK